ncbi:MAG: CrcB family protein [Phycisphaerales bacterium]
MPPILLVAIGGALGSVARYLLAGAFNPPALLAQPQPGAPQWSAFPTGTLVVNFIGCAAIGLIAGWLGVGIAEGASTPNPAWRPFLLTGILGGFTTFSAFSMETLLLARAGMWLPASIYVVASTVLGIALAFAGYKATCHP